MNIIIGIMILFILFLVCESIYMLLLPTKCSVCEIILPKGHVYRISILPYCKHCFDDIYKKAE